MTSSRSSPPTQSTLATAVAVAWKIREACKPEFVVNGEVVRVSASVGIALFPEHGTTTVELLQRANAAMFVAKQSGTGHATFDTAQETQGARQLALLADLRQCIARGHISDSDTGPYGTLAREAGQSHCSA